MQARQMDPLLGQYVYVFFSFIILPCCIHLLLPAVFKPAVFFRLFIFGQLSLVRVDVFLL